MLISALGPTRNPEFDGSFTLCPYYKRNGVIRGRKLQTFQFNSVQAESLPRKKTAFILIHLNVDSYERRKKICIAKKTDS